MLPIFDVLAPIVSKVLDFIPDPQKKAEAQLKLQQEIDANSQMILAALTAVDKAQADINLAETNVTGSTAFKLFVAGWRPALAWTCVFSFFWAYVCAPMVVFWAAFFAHPFTPPVLDNASMEKVLMGILGLGGMRMWEKIQGVQDKH